MRQRGWHFYTFIGAGGARLMCAWEIQPESVDALLADLRDLTLRSRRAALFPAQWRQLDPGLAGFVFAESELLFSDPIQPFSFSKADAQPISRIKASVHHSLCHNQFNKGICSTRDPSLNREIGTDPKYRI